MEQFFGREQEISKLHEIQMFSLRNARFTVITGRRRVGKTSLILKAFENENFLYFFVSRKSEAELCSDFVEEIKQKLHIHIFGNIQRFSDIFQMIMELSKQQHINLVIDEFQDFMRVNRSVFSDMQRIWDLNKNGARINLIVCGSVYSLMTFLFKDNKEPLFGRQTDFMTIEPFKPSVIKQILGVHNSKFQYEDLLALYAFTGGVAKYVEIFMDNECFKYDTMVNYVASKNSFFTDEGKNMLIEEFGRDYGRYFEILSLISAGHTSRGEIESIIGCEVSGYLTRLEKDYRLISKNRPLFQLAQNKSIRYAVDDTFLRFWFRFIYKYYYVISANAFDKLESIIRRDYKTFSGKILELYFKESLKESGSFTRISSWWDRKGENEIDIIAADDLVKSVIFIEVKRNKAEYDEEKLTLKSKRFFEVTGSYTNYDITYKGLSMEDM